MDRGDVDFEYRKILVVGARKTGKTSILSTAGQSRTAAHSATADTARDSSWLTSPPVCVLSASVGGDFSKSYRPTSRCARYYDVQHQLELIDCPGLDDALLNGTKETKEPESFEEIRAHYQSFRDDAIVQEMLTEPKEKGFKENLLIDVDITEVDAYLIVYTDDERSKRVAKALRLAILTKRMHDSRRAIFMLYHHGDFEVAPFLSRVAITDDTRQLEEEKNDPFIELVFRDDVAINTKAYHHPHLKYLPHASAQTGEGIHRTLGVLRGELDRMSGGAGAMGNKPAAGSKGLGGRGKRHVPADLFSLSSSAGAVANLRSALPSTMAGASTAGGAGGQQSERKAQHYGARKTPGAGSTTAGGDEDDAPVTDKGQRAQCTSMAAAACSIQ